MTMLLLGACGGGRAAPSQDQDSLPAWVAEPPQDPGTIAAVGSAAVGHRQQAVERARREVAAQLQVSVAGVRTQRLRIEEEQRPDRQRWWLQSQVDDRVRTAVDQNDLPGMRVEREAVRAGQHHVLVVFDRRAWAAMLAREIAHLDEQIAAVVEPVPGPAVEPAVAIAAAARSWQRAAPLLHRRAGLVERYLVASRSQEPPVPPVTADVLVDRLQGAAAGITLAVRAPEVPARLRQALLGSLGRSGFAQAEDVAGAELVVECSWQGSQHAVDGLVRSDGRLTIAFLAPGERSLGNDSLQKRAGATSSARSWDRLYHALQKTIDRQIPSAVLAACTRFAPPEQTRSLP